MAAATDTPGILHGSAVALGASGVLILGPSGAGKSTLALALMALGAALVADDRVVLSDRDCLPWMSGPPDIAGLIEARFVGLLAADAAPGAWVRLVVDLSRTETERLPPRRTISVLGHDIPLVHKVESAHFAPAILQYLRSGRRA